jgi:hypothetical protein
VNAHLSSISGLRSRATQGYVLQVPLDPERPSHPWHPELVRYWETFGDRIGDSVTPMAPPPGTEGVRVRAIRVVPSIAQSIVPIEMNIVLERLADEDRFDLVIATNVLVYYDAFAQSLALANVGSMLRPGGFFLTNYAAAPPSPMESTASNVTAVFFDRRQQNGDTLFAYQRVNGARSRPD